MPNFNEYEACPSCSNIKRLRKSCSECGGQGFILKPKTSDGGRGGNGGRNMPSEFESRPSRQQGGQIYGK